MTAKNEKERETYTVDELEVIYKNAYHDEDYYKHDPVLDFLAWLKDEENREQNL